MANHNSHNRKELTGDRS